MEPEEGTSVCPVCPFLLALEGAKVCWRGLCCSTEAQDGEEAAEEEEEEEGRRGRSGGEAGGPVGFIFSIMVLKSLEESLSAQCILCVIIMCPTCSLSYRDLKPPLCVFTLYVFVTL